MQDIEKVVIEAYREKFPGAPTEDVKELIQSIGQTVFIEGMAEIVDLIESKDIEIGKSIRAIFEDGKDTDIVPHLTKACVVLKIDIDKILNKVAKDVVSEVLG